MPPPRDYGRWGDIIALDRQGANRPCVMTVFSFQFTLDDEALASATRTKFSLGDVSKIVQTLISVFGSFRDAAT
jgi:hypothetical protein